MQSVFLLPGYVESVINELSLSRGGASEQALFIRQKGVPICANLHLSHSDSKFIKSFQQIRLSSPNTLSAKWLKVSLIYPNENLSPLARQRLPSILVKTSCHVTLQRKDRKKAKKRLSQKGQIKVQTEAGKNVVVFVS